MNDKVKNLRMTPEEAQNYFARILAFTLGPVELKTLTEENEVILVDVRRSEDYEISHIPGAISIPKDDIEDNLDKLSKDKINVVYCYNQQCHLGAKAALIMADYGYPVMLLDGGFQVWKEDFRYVVT